MMPCWSSSGIADQVTRMVTLDIESSTTPGGLAVGTTGEKKEAVI